MFLQSAFNRFGLGFRSLVKWKRGNYIEFNESKEQLFAGRTNHAELELCEEQLRDKYNLQFQYSHSTRNRYLETLNYLEYLETMLDNVILNEANNPHWLDVGSKNFSYAESIYRFLEKQTNDFSLTGIELDAFRIYRDFYSRFDYAQYYIHHLPNATYEVGNILHQRGEYDIISHFLPFIFLEPILKWGLPHSEFAPNKILLHIVSLLKPNGILLIVNQGEDEFEKQKLLIERLNSKDKLLIVEWKGTMQDSFFQFKHKRYGWVLKSIKS